MDEKKNYLAKQIFHIQAYVCERNKKKINECWRDKLYQLSMRVEIAKPADFS